MRTFITFLIAISVAISNAHAQTNTWLWAKGSTGNAINEGMAIATDPSGNVYITGSFFSASVTFGSFTLTNAGVINDIYLVKYDPSGNVLWARSVGGSGDERGNAICTDASGNIYITGYFTSASVAFGSYTLTNAGSTDIFVAKYDPSGNVLWAKAAGGSADDMGNSISADATGNVFVTGHYLSSSITFGSTTLTNLGFLDNFVVKYDPSGNVLWARSDASTFYDEGKVICTDASGNAFLAGYFQNDPITFGSTTLTTAGSVDIFLVRYDPSGNVIWAKSVGGTDAEMVEGLCVDGSGNVIMTGYFQSATITFGSTTLTNTAAGGQDVFIAKYDPSGNVLWARSAGGSGQDIGYDMSTDATGNIYFVGGFASPSITFGTFTLAKPTISKDPMFIVKYDPNGTVLCASVLASGGDDWSGVRTDLFGNVYITGDYWMTPFIVGADALTLADTDAEDIFVAKYKANCEVSEIKNISNDPETTICPNPTSGMLNISSPEKILEVEIYDLVGARVFLSQTNASIIDIDLSRKNNGIYFIKVTTSKGSTIHKLILSK